MALVDRLDDLGVRQKLLILLVLIILMVGAFFQYVYRPKQETIKNLDIQYTALQSDLQSLRVIAAKLPEFQAETRRLQKKLDEIRKQLPQQKEIPGLLENISKSGTANGLEFDLFKPRSEVNKGFYVEVPVDIAIRGPFHNIALFLDEIVHFPRIVNISSFSFGNAKDQEGYVFIVGKCLATTYRYTEREE